jgi:hypothetical protein
MFEGNKGADDGPIHGPSLEVRFAERAVGEGLEGRVAWKKEREPGAGTGQTTTNSNLEANEPQNIGEK